MHECPATEPNAETFARCPAPAPPPRLPPALDRLQRRVPDGLRGRVSSLDFFVSLALMPVSMAIAGPAGAAFGLTAVFLVAGIVPGLLAAAAIILPRLDRDELANPLKHPAAEPIPLSPEETTQTKDHPQEKE